MLQNTCGFCGLWIKSCIVCFFPPVSLVLPTTSLTIFHPIFVHTVHVSQGTSYFLNHSMSFVHTAMVTKMALIHPNDSFQQLATKPSSSYYVEEVTPSDRCRTRALDLKMKAERGSICDSVCGKGTSSCVYQMAICSSMV